MTRTEMETARKEAEKFVKFYQRIAGIQDALAVALQVHADTEQAETHLAQLRAQIVSAQETYTQLEADVALLDALKGALRDEIALLEGQGGV